MLTPIKRWLEPPHFDGDEEKTEQARVFNTLIVNLGAALLFAIFVLVPLFAVQKIWTWLYLIIFFIGAVIARQMIFRGRLRLGSMLIILLVWLCVLSLDLLSGGSTGPTMFFLAAVTLIAGFVLNARAANGMMILTVLVTLGITLLVSQGLALPKLFVFTPLGGWLTFAVGLVFMNGARNIFVRNLENALARAREENTAREHAEATLHESEEKFKAQYKGIPIPTFSWQSVGNDLILVDYNDSAFEFTQGGVINLLGKSASAVYRDDPETFNELIECSRTKVNVKRERWHRLTSTNELKYIAINYAFVPPNLVMIHVEDITERKRAEETRRLRESYLTAILENQPGLVWLKDRDGCFLTVNQAFADSCGRALPADLVGKTDLDIWPKELAEKYIADDTSVIKNKIPVSVEELIFDHDKSIWFETFKTPVLDDKGNVIGTTGYARDISERKQSELEREVLYQVLRAVSIQLDADLVARSAAETIVKLTGYPHVCIALPDEAGAHWVVRGAAGSLAAELGATYPIHHGVIGRTFRTEQTQWVRDILNDPNYVRDVSAANAPALRSELVVPLRRGDHLLGALNIESERVNAFSDADAKMILSLADMIALAMENARLYKEAQQELAERKHAEQALVESEARFRAVVETANDAIITMDTQGNIVSWNAAAEIIFGFSKDEILGKPVNQIVPEQFRARQRRSIEQTLASNERRIVGKTIHVTGLAKDGRQFPIEMSLAEWQTQAGNFFTAIIRDISERQQAEERIRQSEKKYRELFQVNKDGIAIFLLNPQGPPSTFVEVNNAAAAMLGYTWEEMLQLTPVMLEPNVTREIFQSRQFEFESKGVATFETVLLHKDGHPVFTEFTAQKIQYEDQPAIMNIVRDITERKQHENELRAIATLSAALRTAPTRVEMLPVIVDQLSNLLECDSMSVEIIDPTTNESVIEAAYGAWSSIIGFRQPPGTGMNAIISTTRRPHLNNNLKGGLKHHVPSYPMDNILASAGVPLIAQDQVIGFIWLGHSQEIAEAQVRLLAAVADIAANAIYRATLHEQTQKDATNLALAYDTTLEGWAHALELRDQETEGHTRRVVQLTVDLARAMGIGEDELEHVRRGALLHDIGKMGIPDSVLLKPGTLNEREWEVMQRHPEYAYQFLEPIEYLRPALDIPYCHHEKWDGTGYPRQLAGEQIPLAARVFAIVDVWDALRSDRPYRKAWSAAQSLKHIQEGAGKHFDPQVVQAFLKIAR